MQASSPAELDRLISIYGTQTILAAVAPMVSDARFERIDQILRRRLSSLTMVIENLYDGHNGAAAIRSIEAFGLQSMWAVEQANRFPISADVATGAQKWIDIERTPDVDTCARRLRERGFKLAATTPSAPMSFAKLDMNEAWAIWFGNERDGLTKEALAAADTHVSIPMQGFTRSFNLSVSVALVSGQLSAARRKQLGCEGDLSEERIEHLRARWAATGIRGVGEIIARFVSDASK